ncbi:MULTISPECIES: hypothetical protein [unclassified Mycobacterium]|uniref:hypothetical protein n=1 Tax=unclassified Mycobacterium TaxID=2642494 RepID=UPI000AEE3742|nr:MULTISPECIES: hypothetical protein [unclassified Mycobacterium]
MINDAFGVDVAAAAATLKHAAAVPAAALKHRAAAAATNASAGLEVHRMAT